MGATAHHHNDTFGSINDELLAKSVTMDAANDIIKAEQSLMAQHDYLQKMETERLKNRTLSVRNSTKRKERLAASFNERKIQNADTLNAEKKVIEEKISETQKNLKSFRQMLTVGDDTNLNDDKSKRLGILLKIASADDDSLKFERRLKNVDVKIKKSKAALNINTNGNNLNTPHNMVSPPGSKLTTADALNYIDAALSMSTLKSMESMDDEDTYSD